MKKYKVYWSVFNLLNSSQEEVVKLQMLWAGIATTVTTSTYIAASEKEALLAAIISAIVDKLVLGCFYFQKEESNTPPDAK